MEVCVGALSNLRDVEIVRICDHLYVEDILNGGVFVMICCSNPDGVTILCWVGMKNESAKLDLNFLPKEHQFEALQAMLLEDVSVRCYYGGVNVVFC